MIITLQGHLTQLSKAYTINLILTLHQTFIDETNQHATKTKCILAQLDTNW